MIAPASRSRSPPEANPKPRDYLSFSALRSYQSCPLRYFFRYVAGLPDTFVSASLVFGAAIHRAVEFHFHELLAGNEPPTLDLLLQQYTHEWKERAAAKVRIGKEEKRGSLNALAQRMLTAFQHSELSKPSGRILGVEEELRGSLVNGVPDLLGKLDLITETQDELVISDWKTSRSKWNNSNLEEASEQLLLYSELVKDFAPGKRLRIEFAVLTKTKEVSIERHSLLVNLVQVHRMKRVFERVWQAISSGHFYPAPSPMACGSCPYREPCRKWPG